MKFSDSAQQAAAEYMKEARLPKTFTNALYENSEITSQADEFLGFLLPQIIADAEQTIEVEF